MRAVLGLHEGVVTGAADGFGRMAGRPAATLLHLGPGLGNGLAGLHNARRAFTPVVNVVGDHATYHRQYDAPLNSDIELLGSWLGGWVKTTKSVAEVGADAAEAIAAAMTPPGRIATLVLARRRVVVGGRIAGRARRPFPRAHASGDAQVAGIADVLRSGEQCLVLIGGAATRERCTARGEPDRRRQWREAPGRDVPRATRARRGTAGDRARRLSRRARRGSARRRRAPDPRGHARAGLLLRLSGQAERPRARRLHRARARGRQRRLRRRAGTAGRPGRARCRAGSAVACAAGDAERRADRGVDGRRRSA